MARRRSHFVSKFSSGITMKSCITISLVEEARGGPFVLWDGLEKSIAVAAELGYDAVEIFAPGAESIDVDSLEKWLEASGLKLAALGTGAGWVKHRLQLADSDASKRKQAIAFVRSIIDAAGPLGRPPGGRPPAKLRPRPAPARHPSRARRAGSR